MSIGRAVNFNSTVLPVLPLRDVVIFPNIMLPLFVGREKSVHALEYAISSSSHQNEIFLIAQKDGSIDNPEPENLYEVGVLANIIQPLIKLPDNAVKVMIHGVRRGRVIEYISSHTLLQARVALDGHYEYGENEDNIDLEALRRSVIDAFDNWCKLSKKSRPEIIIDPIDQVKEVNQIVDMIASHLNIKVSDKQNILEVYNPKERLKKVFALIEREISILSAQNRLYKTIKSQVESTQKVYYLNEQLKAIQKELGEFENGDEGNILNEFEKKINETKLSEEAKEKAITDLKRYKKMNPISPEATVISSYLHWLLDLPWGKYKDAKINLNAAKKILDENHYGIEKVKDRIIEFLAVLKRVKEIKGPILCLVGPPGVGKTSLAKSMAKAVGRDFVRISLGGIRDESEIRGHRKTYIGSMPGKIIQHMKKANSCNPLFLLDEIDKMGSDSRGDPASALLEVLDTEHNKHFTDHYLEVEFDLSSVMFVATANSLNLPHPLRDRMEIIQLSGYTEDEKISIATHHLIPKLKKEHGLHQKEWEITNEALYELIRLYTRESGVRSMKRELAKLMRKAVKAILTDKNKKISVETGNLQDYLGVRKYTFGIAENESLVGIVTGLAYTETGGDILMIESVLIPGKGEIKYTGKLGEVMQESIKAAYSYVRSNCLFFGIKPEKFQNNDIHLHVPEGAVPKDGPSAGSAVCTSIVSLMTNISVNKSVAMTGEVTLRGRVLAIGGLREKLLAALRGSIKIVIIPSENEKDMQEIPANIKEGINVIFAKNIDEVIKIALTRPITSIDGDNQNSLPSSIENKDSTFSALETLKH
ncbi:ATP-dependent protease La [Wolbachia endosymbiont of Drosophila simulans wNo]|uniref:endopeptidase La n=1 Tax=unclassified Wolbachia TaxID=2640676 RepID=UPI0002D24AC1|nr:MULTISPECIES: endopeptidase La [unclassified Wolbachia]AGJ98709.1 ATP-dependent protease La [Wolbachia endosymbiont of Drosophila simulans wNo]QCB62902.1 endopeptidase La [Wolbachia endosymbiont of Drosophila mauritiana]QCB63947.1 endopeptidase La [Wolbachia endosymbiont of Drosophila mauritiana]QWE33790.1 Lon protease [Wolbachia endosymbiont of Drosophila simulans]TGB06234.1 endopeptidase La [Wolbachia endosymbiont of Drosophila mauritiana]